MASSSNTKGSNPAPDFALFMNRIQVSLDAGSRSADFIQRYKKQAAAKVSSSSSTTSPNPSATTTSTGGAFSCLQPLKPTTPSSTTPARTNELSHAARIAAEEAEFADDRSADPNAGIGFARPKGTGLIPTTQRERDTQKLRGRLLGGRNKNNAGSRDDHAAGDARRRQLAMRGRGGGDSSDDEPGRSGLGRAKKVVTKRRREEVDSDEEEKQEEEGREEGGKRHSREADIPRIVTPAEPSEVTVQSTTQSGSSMAPEITTPVEIEGQLSESKAKRKKKKKKAKKSSS